MNSIVAVHMFFGLGLIGCSLFALVLCVFLPWLHETKTQRPRATLSMAEVKMLLNYLDKPHE